MNGTSVRDKLSFSHKGGHAGEGSNFLALHTTYNGLCLDKARCFTTNVMEILGCLGLMRGVSWVLGEMPRYGGSMCDVQQWRPCEITGSQ